MELHGYVPRSAASADTVPVDVAADIDEVCTEFRDQAGHVEIGAMPAALTGCIQPAMMSGQVAKRLNPDGPSVRHAPIEAQQAAESNLGRPLMLRLKST